MKMKIIIMKTIHWLRHQVGSYKISALRLYCYHSVSGKLSSVNTSQKISLYSLVSHKDVKIDTWWAINSYKVGKQ